MATYAESIGAALDTYPQTDTFLHRRSAESVYAANYLRGKIRAHTDDATLRKIVNFLLTGGNPPEGKPADLKKLKHSGKLYTLLDGAQRGRLQDKKLSVYETTKMADDPDAAGIDLPMRRKYDAAIEMWLKHKVDGSRFWKEKREDTLASLVGLAQEKHLWYVSKIWNDIIELHVGRKFVASMIDPDNDGRAFVSSHNLDRAFSLHGHAFRCDTRPPADVSAQGFLPLYQFRCPEYIKDTHLEQAAKGTGGQQRSLGFWTDNRDALGEMTICVSRQMRGCTKFPEPDYDGPAWIYALGLPLNKIGFDTEAWQMTKGGDALWRPGEKAFYDVQPSEVLASLYIYKLPHRSDQPGEFFRFQILSDRWEWHHANEEQQRHLNKELDDLYSGGQIQVVKEDEDFYKDRADEKILQQQRAARLVAPAQGAQTFHCDRCQQNFPTRVKLTVHQCPALKVAV